MFFCCSVLYCDLLHIRSQFLLDPSVHWPVCSTPLRWRDCIVWGKLRVAPEICWCYCSSLDVDKKKVIDCFICSAGSGWCETERRCFFGDFDDDDWSFGEKGRDSPPGLEQFQAIWTISCWLRSMTHPSDPCSLKTEDWIRARDEITKDRHLQEKYLGLVVRTFHMITTFVLTLYRGV